MRSRTGYQLADRRWRLDPPPRTFEPLSESPGYRWPAACCDPERPRL